MGYILWQVMVGYVIGAAIYELGGSIALGITIFLYTAWSLVAYHHGHLLPYCSVYDRD